MYCLKPNTGSSTNAKRGCMLTCGAVAIHSEPADKLGTWDQKKVSLQLSRLRYVWLPGFCRPRCEHRLEGAVSMEPLQQNACLFWRVNRDQLSCGNFDQPSVLFVEKKDTVTMFDKLGFMDKNVKKSGWGSKLFCRTLYLML